MGLSIATPPFPARVTTLEAPATPRNDAARLTACAVPILLVITLNALGRSDLDPVLRLLASMVCFLGCLPWVAHVIGRKTALPFMPLYALLFAGYFGIGVFLDDKFAVPLSGVMIADPIIVEAEGFILLGFVMLLAGFYFPGGWMLNKIPRLHRGVDEETGVQTGWVLAVIGLLFVQFRGYIPTRFGSFAAIIQQFAALGLALLFYYYLQGRVRGLQAFLLLALIPGMALIDLSNGGVGPILEHFLPLVGTYWLVRRKFLWKTTLLVVLLIIPVSGVKGKFRAVAWVPGINMGLVERSQLYYDLISDGFKTDDRFYYDSFQSTVQRMNQIPTMATVELLTPSTIPYWQGATYADLYWSLIPRFLYPDKPGKTLGQDFGHRYGLLDKWDRTTSYNFPQVVEFYANFGVWGVAIGMFLLGVLQRFVYHIFTAPDAHASVALFATIILARCCSIDSDLSLVYGGLFLNILAVLIVLALLRAKRIRLPLDLLRFRW